MTAEPQQPVRFGIVGCGVIGTHHARVISSLGEQAALTAVADIDHERAAKLAADHGCSALPSVDALLARDDVDVVSVCVPSGRHADLGVKALEVGKDVLVEKPVDVSLAATDRLLAAQRATGRLVAVVSQHRFDPAAVLVRDAIATGKLGRITSATVTVAWWRSPGYYTSGDWRGTWALDGGGALMNQSVHTVDLLVWMLGDPVEVFAYTDRLAHDGIEVEDTAAAVVRFAGGAVATVLGTTAAYPGLTARLQVHGGRGSAVIDDDKLEYFHVAPESQDSTGSVEGEAYGAGGTGNQASDVLGEPQPESTGAGSDPANLSDAHLFQYRDLIDARTHGRSPLVTVEDARKPLALILGIYESARTGLPVRLGG